MCSCLHLFSRYSRGREKQMHGCWSSHLVQVNFTSPSVSYLALQHKEAAGGASCRCLWTINCSIHVTLSASKFNKFISASDFVIIATQRLTAMLSCKNKLREMLNSLTHSIYLSHKSQMANIICIPFVLVYSKGWLNTYVFYVHCALLLSKTVHHHLVIQSFKTNHATHTTRQVEGSGQNVTVLLEHPARLTNLFGLIFLAKEFTWLAFPPRMHMFRWKMKQGVSNGFHSSTVWYKIGESLSSKWRAHTETNTRNFTNASGPEWHSTKTQRWKSCALVKTLDDLDLNSLWNSYWLLRSLQTYQQQKIVLQNLHIRCTHTCIAKK